MLYLKSLYFFQDKEGNCEIVPLEGPEEEVGEQLQEKVMDGFEVFYVIQSNDPYKAKEFFMKVFKDKKEPVKNMYKLTDADRKVIEQYMDIF